jgi:hypothetical protein
MSLENRVIRLALVTWLNQIGTLTLKNDAFKPIHAASGLAQQLATIVVDCIEIELHDATARYYAFNRYKGRDDNDLILPVIAAGHKARHLNVKASGRVPFFLTVRSRLNVRSEPRSLWNTVKSFNMLQKKSEGYPNLERLDIHTEAMFGPRLLGHTIYLLQLQSVTRLSLSADMGQPSWEIALSYVQLSNLADFSIASQYTNCLRYEDILNFLRRHDKIKKVQLLCDVDPPQRRHIPRLDQLAHASFLPEMLAKFVDGGETFPSLKHLDLCSDRVRRNEFSKQVQRDVGALPDLTAKGLELHYNFWPLDEVRLFGLNSPSWPSCSDAGCVESVVLTLRLVGADTYPTHVAKLVARFAALKSVTLFLSLSENFSELRGLDVWCAEYRAALTAQLPTSCNIQVLGTSASAT